MKGIAPGRALDGPWDLIAIHCSISTARHAAFFLVLCADVLYLFGKVSASSGNGSSGGGKGGSNSWQSCCVVVPNLHRSLLVVPRPEVFDDSDGQIAALEAAVAADPARKIELLQVRKQAWSWAVYGNEKYQCVCSTAGALQQRKLVCWSARQCLLVLTVCMVGCCCCMCAVCAAAACPLH